MNAHESENLACLLESNGFIQGDKMMADIIIFNTCCIRDTAEQKILTHISQAVKTGKGKQTICVIGCLSAKQKIKGADICLGTDAHAELLTFLQNKFASAPTNNSNIRTNVTHKNAVIIMHGCENFCSYCIVPYVRGKERSRPIEEIEKDFLEIVKSKAYQCDTTASSAPIYLFGQNVNSYHCPKTNTDFVGLLDRLCALPYDFKLNFLSSHPKDFTQSLIDCIARNPKIERNIHLPLQSGCDKILALMNRKYTVAEYESKISALRTAVPNIHITTDIICGFPDETEEDFAQTRATLQRIKFDASFIFPYSRRTGTVANDLPNQLDTATKKRRATELIALMREMSKPTH